MQAKHIKMEEKGLVREITSRAILSTDQNALRAHRRRIQQLKDNQVALIEINSMKDRVDELTDDIIEIKNLLRQLIGN